MLRPGKPALAAGTLTLALATLAAPSLAGVPATNPNGAFIDLDVTTSALTSTAKKPVGLFVEFHSFTGNRLGKSNGVTSDIKVAFPKGSKFNGASFPQCKLNTTDFSTCPAASQIGAGTAEGSIANPDGTTTFIPTDLKGYNGSVVGGKPTVIFLSQVGGKTVAELDFTVANGASGPVLDDYVIPGAPANTVSIAQFNLTVPDKFKKSGKGKKRKVTHFISAPSSCPRSGWTFTQTNTYDFGTLAADATTACVKLK